MPAFHMSDKELEKLLAEGQHSIMYANSLSLLVPYEVKKAKQPDTEVTKALKRAKRKELQDAFFNTWCMLGGDRDAWIEEYMFHPTRKWRFDFANLEAKIAVECNGGQWTKSGHSSGRGLQRDAEKTNAANALGWTVYTLTTSMLSKREAIGNVAEIMKAVKGE